MDNLTALREFIRVIDTPNPHPASDSELLDIYPNAATRRTLTELLGEPDTDPVKQPPADATIDPAIDAIIRLCSLPVQPRTHELLAAQYAALKDPSKPIIDIPSGLDDLELLLRADHGSAETVAAVAVRLCYIPIVCNKHLLLCRTRSVFRILERHCPLVKIEEGKQPPCFSVLRFMLMGDDELAAKQYYNASYRPDDRLIDGSTLAHRAVLLGSLPVLTAMVDLHAVELGRCSDALQALQQRPELLRVAHTTFYTSAARKLAAAAVEEHRRKKHKKN